MNWNPFALAGPPFLLFYAVLMLVTLVALRRRLLAAEVHPSIPAPKLDDPYLIAHLRGGTAEALRVATVSLIDRNLLELQGDQIALRDARAVEVARRDIEKAVLRAYRQPGDGRAVLGDQAARAACAAYQATLERHGLLADAATRAARQPQVLLALAVLWGVAAARVVQALAQGRHNIGFLIILALLAGAIAGWLWLRRRTFAGDAALADLQVLFKRLKVRAKSLGRGGAGNEVALLIAVFGIGALPTSAFPFVEKVYPRQSSGDSSSSGSSDSSSCSGGCGGGGCGGCGSD